MKKLGFWKKYFIYSLIFIIVLILILFFFKYKYSNHCIDDFKKNQEYCEDIKLVISALKIFICVDCVLYFYLSFAIFIKRLTFIKKVKNHEE